ncbi:MAG: hypothetical protein RJP95_03105 [Pirellulales bacterium]
MRFERHPIRSESKPQARVDGRVHGGGWIVLHAQRGIEQKVSQASTYGMRPVGSEPLLAAKSRRTFEGLGDPL